MKYLAILTVLLFAACCKTEPCECVKKTYQWEHLQDEVGNWHCTFPELAKTETVPCQDEVYEVTSDTTYTIIVCDER